MRSADLIGLADHPALDFLNSTAVPAHERVELVRDGESYLDWLVQAGLLDSGDRVTAVKMYPPTELDAVAAEAVALREWLRPVVTTWASSTAAGVAVPAAARLRLDAILEQDRLSFRVPVAGGHVGLARVRHWHTARQLLVPVAEATAQLFVHGERSLVRRCEGPTCTLWFYDRTKSHRRRWCSMAACGNRAKARAHRDRTR